MVWGIFSWHRLGPLVPTEHYLNVTAYLSIVADHIHIFTSQLHDAVESIQTKTSEECFQHLLESMPWRFKTVLKAKGGPTWYKQGVPNQVSVKQKDNTKPFSVLRSPDNWWLIESELPDYIRKYWLLLCVHRTERSSSTFRKKLHMRPAQKPECSFCQFSGWFI